MAVLFISRGTMSGVQRLVECLRDRAGARSVSREDLIEVVNRHGELATQVVERLANADRAYEQFSQARRPYEVLMRMALLERVRIDHVVYHGYSGHLLVPRLRHFVRVRVDAPLYQRIPMTMERLHCDDTAAREYIAREDERHVRWARFMYGCDIRDTSLYDLWLNLERMTLTAACGILQCVLGEPDFQATDESRAELERHLLAARVESALVADSRTHTIEVSASVAPDGVQIVGPYLEEDMLALVREIAGGVPGVSTVQYTPGFAPALGMRM